MSGLRLCMCDGVMVDGVCQTCGGGIAHLQTNRNLALAVGVPSDVTLALQQVPGQLIEAPAGTGLKPTADISQLMRPMIREAFRELGTSIDNMRLDIQAQNELMRHMDVPMEAIADSHERASASFETLREDIFKGGLDKLEKVLDTSGLSEQASKAERRMEELAKRIEAKVDAAFKSHAEDMVNILHLLERLQARELRETKNRMQRAASAKVRRGPRV